MAGYRVARAFERIPEITGLDLTRHGQKWQGPYYIDGTKHMWRRDKLKFVLWKNDIYAFEEGGRGLSLVNWLIQYGGCSDYRDALRVIDGESAGIKWTQEYRQIVNPKARYVDPSALEGARQYDLHYSPLFVFLCGIYPEQRVTEVFNKYNVTANSRHETVFWYVDAEGHICHDKKVHFLPNGHRDKQRSMGRDYRVGDGYSARTLFGAHLIPEKGEICLLESEKSVLICALEYPEKCWTACGGKGNLRGVNERFLLYPDLDSISDWSGTTARIEEWWLDWKLPAEQRPATADFADMIIYNHG